MKKIFLIIILIILVGCSSKKIMEFRATSSMNYINQNRENIESVIVTRLTLGSHDCYSVDVDKAYKSMNELKILKESNKTVTDNYMWYTFYFKDGTKTTFSFEGPYLYYNNKGYTIKFDALKLLEKDRIECKYYH